MTRADIKLVCGDAALFSPPQQAVVCYLYNPFGADVMRKVIGAWTHAMSLHSLDVWIVYSNPTHLDLFRNELMLEHLFTKKGTAVLRRSRPNQQ